jgi:hypothetical protein
MSISDVPELRVDPTAPTRAGQALRGPGGRFEQPVPADASTATPGRGRREHEPEPVVATAGQLRPAYAQYVLDPQTHEVSVRVRDAATHEMLSQIPPAEVAALNRSMREYAELLARHHAAAQAKAGA